MTLGWDAEHTRSPSPVPPSVPQVLMTANSDLFQAFIVLLRDAPRDEGAGGRYSALDKIAVHEATQTRAWWAG
jgi:hypothetical protein